MNGAHMDPSFESLMDQARRDHPEEPAVVAARLATMAALVQAPAQLQTLAHLMHHVWGEHLHDWAGGQRALQALASHAHADATTHEALQRYRASLSLSAGSETLAAPLSPSDQVRAHAMAAANVTGCDTGRAQALLLRALALAKAHALPDNDPCMRALAVGGHNLACELEEKPERSPAERELMLLAAQVSRAHWALAGGWLEVERAEYRLSNSWRLAGDATRARAHAQACLALVQQHGAPALEAFFGWEVMALAEQALGDGPAQAAALDQARAAFEQLGADDQVWCRATLDKLLA